jgi:membrane associated rhomboid family serine protease
MGIYDREYYRDEPRRPGIGQWSAVTTLIVLNVVVFVADMFTPVTKVEFDGHVVPANNIPQQFLNAPGVNVAERWLDGHMALQPDLIEHPWNAWQLLTYGFAHAPGSLMHILFNMFGLWMFGRDVENIYGKSEFYRLYSSLIVMSGLAWIILDKLLGEHAPGVVGASGAVVGITMIYIFHFPHRIFLLFFAIPMPAWAAGIVFIALDVAGATGTFQLTGENVANTAHLAGAAFGFIYYQFHWTLFSLWPGRWFSQTFRRPKFRVHRGDDRDARDDPQLQQQVDLILSKISREGEASLTADERRTLEEASRRYRGQGPGARGQG